MEGRSRRMDGDDQDILFTGLKPKKKQKIFKFPGTDEIVHAFKPRTWEAETDGYL